MESTDQIPPQRDTEIFEERTYRESPPASAFPNALPRTQQGQLPVESPPPFFYPSVMGQRSPRKKSSAQI